jgi:hypothetical protein
VARASNSGQARPNPHKALGVKRQYFLRPRGAAFSLTPFLRGHGSGGEGTASATRLAISGRRDPGPRRPTTSRTPHSCGLRRPSPARPGGCAGEQAPAGPDPHSFPAPWPFKERRAHLPQGRGPFGTAHGRGGSSGVSSSFGAAARRGSGGPRDGASAPSPYSVRQLHADLVLSPDPPPGRRPRTDHRGQGSNRRGRRPTKASGGRGCGPGHAGRTRGPVTSVCRRCGWPRRLPFGRGSPAAPGLRAARSG